MIIFLNKTLDCFNDDDDEDDNENNDEDEDGDDEEEDNEDDDDEEEEDNDDDDEGDEEEKSIGSDLEEEEDHDLLLSNIESHEMKKLINFMRPIKLVRRWSTSVRNIFFKTLKLKLQIPFTQKIERKIKM